MKTVLLILSLFLVGCSGTNVEPPAVVSHPKFPIGNFKKSKAVETNPWIEKDKKGVYIVYKKEEWDIETENIVSLRKKYNLLIDKIYLFNKRIDILNKNQKDKNEET